MKRVNCITKRSFLILLLSIFVILPPTASIVGAEIITEDQIEKESSGLFESILSKTVLSLTNSLISITGAQDVSVLIFQQDSMQQDNFFTSNFIGNKESLVYGIFPQSIYSGIEVFYNTFNSAIPMPITIMLMFGGFLLLLDIFKGNGQRSQIKELLLGLIFAVVAMNFGSVLWQLVIGLNDIIVSGVYDMLVSNGIPVGSFISTIWNTGATDSIWDSKNLLVAVMVLMACCMTFLINYQYMMRMITIGVLIVLFPIVVVMLVLPSKRSAIGQWMALFTSNVFMQTAHAVTMGLFFLFLNSANGFDFWLVLVIFFGLPAVSDLVTRIVGMAFGDGFGGGVGTSMKNMSGMSNIMGMAMLAKNMAGGNKTSGSTDPSGVVDKGIATAALANNNANSSAPIGTSISESTTKNSAVNSNQSNSSNSTNSNAFNSNNGTNTNNNSNTAQQDVNNQSNQQSGAENSTFAQKANEYNQQVNSPIDTGGTMGGVSSPIGPSLDKDSTVHNQQTNSTNATTQTGHNSSIENGSSYNQHQTNGNVHQQQSGQNHETNSNVNPTSVNNQSASNVHQSHNNHDAQQNSNTNTSNSTNQNSSNVHAQTNTKANTLKDKADRYLQTGGALMKKGVAVTGTGIARTSEFARNSNGLKMNAKRAALVAAIGAGAVVSTMATGKAQSGAIAGAVGGKALNKVGGKVADKTSRVTQIGGEVLKSKGEGKKAFDTTKERVGYKSPAQLANKKEAQRIVQELFGGKTGTAIGTATAKSVNYAASKDVRNVGGFNPRKAVRRETQRQNLEQVKLPAIQNQIAQQQQVVQQAEQQYKQAIEQRTVNGGNPQNRQQAQQQVQVAHQNLEKQRGILTSHQAQESKIQTRLNNFYELEQAKIEARKLQKSKAE